MKIGTLPSFPHSDTGTGFGNHTSIEESVVEQNSERINPLHDKVKQLPMPQSLDDSVSSSAKSESIDLPEIIVSSNENLQPVKDICIDDGAISQKTSPLGQQIISLEDDGLSIPVAEKTMNISNSPSKSGSNTPDLEAILEEFSGSWETEKARAKGENTEESSPNAAATASNQEESCFTASCSLSESITNSGLAAGNLSLRSDSTTSVRSFAFPVLQNEWNSSPVRLAKAERMHRRMLRRWTESLLCCKF